MQPSTPDILARLNISALNAMQEAAGAAISTRRDVLLLAPTGMGKTLGFLLPALELLQKQVKQVQCLVIVPSRELALQTEEVWKKMATGYKCSSCYGGHAIATEINNLSIPPALLIGTPGRLADLVDRGIIDTGSITTLVLDEFDKSLALGFEEEMAFIASRLTSLRQRVLVSATNAIEIPEFAGVKEPEVIDFISAPITAPALQLLQVIADDKDKIDTLFRLLCHIGGEAAIVFCNYREAAERVSTHIAGLGIDNAFFHGGMEQPEREQTLVRFSNGSVWFLVATGLAARGLDIPDVKHIIHYHIPATGDEFLHRNGRTARMHGTGTAYLLLHSAETLPDYVTEPPPVLPLPAQQTLPPAAAWTTVYINGGRKDKINKTDIAGFFMKTGGLQKDELGIITSKDYLSFAAVKKDKVRALLANIQEEKIKGKKYKIGVVKR